MVLPSLPFSLSFLFFFAPDSVVSSLIFTSVVSPIGTEQVKTSAFLFGLYRVRGHGEGGGYNPCTHEEMVAAPPANVILKQTHTVCFHFYASGAPTASQCVDRSVWVSLRLSFSPCMHACLVSGLFSSLAVAFIIAEFFFRLYLISLMALFPPSPLLFYRCLCVYMHLRVSVCGAAFRIFSLDGGSLSCSPRLMVCVDKGSLPSQARLHGE